MAKNKFIIGLEIYSQGLSNFKLELYESLMEDRSTGIHLCNAYTIALASKDTEIHNLLKNSSYNLPDGKPLSKILSPWKSIQIKGLHLVSEILSDINLREQKHLFYGSDTTGAQQLKKYLDAEYNNQNNIHCLPAPYLDVDDFDIDAIVQYCERNDIKFIWIGLGTPKQDFMVNKIIESTERPLVVIPVGAVFDFLIGRKAKAPEFISKMGFEWLFRLISEPRRLSKRYFVYNSVFIIVVLRSLSRSFMEYAKKTWKN